MNDFIKELLSEFRTSALFKRELDNLMQPFYDDPALIDAICVFEKPGDWVTDRNDQLQAIFESESRNTLIMVSKDDLKKLDRKFTHALQPIDQLHFQNDVNKVTNPTLKKALQAQDAISQTLLDPQARGITPH